jgi:pantoate--beta-alanine ligase
MREPVKIIRKIPEMQESSRRLHAAGETIGFVPTMGYLHEGHLSLVRAARAQAGAVVVSIFVNPSQFGPREDFASYPRNLERDAALLQGEGVDIVFHPEASDVYPAGYRTYVEVQGLQDKLCGRTRPDHFRGVSTVVLKLFEIVRPDLAFFGQKDAQQAVILKKMASDLNLDVRLEILPIIREPDGLAMSSRNSYLSPVERKAAVVLSKSLETAREEIDAGERRPDIVLAGIRKLIEAEPLARIDYIEAVETENLDPVKVISEGTLIALAVFIGKTRLIDNMIVRSQK